MRLTGGPLQMVDVILDHLPFTITIGFAGGNVAGSGFLHLLICLFAAKLIPEYD
jgi:hypothetical protein